MPFFLMSGRNRSPAVCFAPSDSGQGASLPGYDAELTQLDAQITDLGFSSSHPSFQARAHDGSNWTVELGDRAQISRAGLTDRQAAPGDHVTIRGHRASGFGDRSIRAVNVTIAGREFALMPETCLGG